MEFDKEKRFESVYSQKVKAGKRRTYFFDVRKTKGSDYFVTITESTRRFEDDNFIRHKIFLYKEDFSRFMASLNDVIDHVKTELMPDYDYEEYARRYDEENEEQEDGEKEAQLTSDILKGKEIPMEEVVEEVKEEEEEEAYVAAIDLPQEIAKTEPSPELPAIQEEEEDEDGNDIGTW